MNRRGRRGGGPAPRSGGRSDPRAAEPAFEHDAVVARLLEGLGALDLDSNGDPAGLAERLAAYLALLARWNSAYNLTAVRDPLEMVARHVLDSLAVEPWVVGPRIADVGTGCGLPGIPLALLRPRDHFTLIDSAGKRTRFVRHAVARLGLENVEVVAARVQDYDGGPGFDTVVSRAFAAVGDFVTAAGHLRRKGGRLLAMKGVLPHAELGALPAGWRVTALGRLTVPGLAAERHAVLLSGPPEDEAR